MGGMTDSEQILLLRIPSKVIETMVGDSDRASHMDPKPVRSPHVEIINGVVNDFLKQFVDIPREGKDHPDTTNGGESSIVTNRTEDQDISQILLYMARSAEPKSCPPDRDASDESSLKQFAQGATLPATTQNKIDADEVAAQYTNISALVNGQKTAHQIKGIPASSSQLGSNTCPPSPIKTTRITSMVEAYRQLNKQVIESAKNGSSTDAASYPVMDLKSDNPTLLLEDKVNPLVARVPNNFLSIGPTRKLQNHLSSLPTREAADVKDEIKVQVVLDTTDKEAASSENGTSAGDSGGSPTTYQLGSNTSTPSPIKTQRTNSMVEAYRQLNKMVESVQYDGSTEDQDSTKNPVMDLKSDGATSSSAAEAKKTLVARVLHDFWSTRSGKTRGATGKKDEINVRVVFDLMDEHLDATTSFSGLSTSSNSEKSKASTKAAAERRKSATSNRNMPRSASSSEQGEKEAEADFNVAQDNEEKTRSEHLRNTAVPAEAKSSSPSRESADINANGRKRKQEMQAVISDSEGEIQGVSKKRASESADQEEVNSDNVKMDEGHSDDECPIALREIFENDFRERDKSFSAQYLKTTVDTVWRRLPKHIKQSLPLVGHGTEELRKWKAKHFGERTPRPVFVRNCPELLIEMLREDIARKTKSSHKELSRNVNLTWNLIPSDAKECLPRGNVPEYLAELKKWKAQYVPDAAVVQSSKPSARKRSRPISSGDQKSGSMESEIGRSSSHSSSQESQTTSNPVEDNRMDGGKTTDNHVPADVSSSTRDEETPLQEMDVDTTALEPLPFVQKDDSNKFYVEEEAHLFHNPPLPSLTSKGVPPDELKPIPPPPPPFDDLPNTGKCEWSWDNEERILLANFCSPASPSNAFVMDPEDETFFLQMMERNDLTVISEGLVSVQSLNPDYWKPEYLRRVLGQEYYHKFRRFDTSKTKEGFEKCFEVDGMVSMKVGDYIRYLEKRQSYLGGVMDGAEPSFSYVNHEGRSDTLDNVGKTALYMIDFDINRLLPKLSSNFFESFRYHGILPGGTHCMMNSVTSTARPFMGPNLYVTPPAAFTHFHQDGHGTVDSGHLCLRGYNEVVILRRLTERHKQHSLMILTGNLGGNKKQKSFPTYFDGLYQEPHGDLLGEKPSWPTEAQIEKCRDMGYCPTVCIVKPGQLIHINKGRLHAFRKMSIAALPEGDCHKKLREKTIEEYKLTKETLCVSIAWDWMYRGVSVGGINREFSSVLEAVVLNRKNGKLSLAIPEFSLFQMAKILNPGEKTASSLESFLPFGRSDSREQVVTSIPDAKTICRGILPSLRHVMKQQLTTLGNASSSASTSESRGERVTIAKRPNTHEDPLEFPLDPYGLDGFACKLCSRELSNVYYHCDGCEKLLSKDFNICLECHKDQKFMCTVIMHPTNPKRHASLNHTGTMKGDRVSRCPCKNGPVCGHCNFCLGCSCRCHTWFTLHSRMFGEEEGKALLSGIDAACMPCDSEESHKLGDLLAERLEEAAIGQ